MMDWIAGAYGGIKAAADITQSMLTLKTDAAVTSKVIELNGVLIDLQNKMYEAQTERQKLLDEIKRLQDDLRQKARFDDYRLSATEAGDYILQLKPELANGDRPAHAICPVCAEKGTLSYLKEETYHYHCNACSKFYAKRIQSLSGRPNPRVI
ncbi:TPA: hypothetical protein ACWMLF_004717 [Pseudomonas aeruginosa]